MPDTKLYTEAILFDKEAALQIQVFRIMQFLRQMETVVGEMPKELQEQLDATKFEAAQKELIKVVRYGLGGGRLIDNKRKRSA